MNIVVDLHLTLPAEASEEVTGEKQSKKKQKTRSKQIYETTLLKAHGRVKELLHDQAYAEQKKDSGKVSASIV